MFSFSVLIIFILSSVDGNIRNKTNTITVSNNVHELPYLTSKHYIQIMDILLEERRLRRLLEQDVKELQHKVNVLNFKPTECIQNLECIDRVQIHKKEFQNKNSDNGILQNKDGDTAMAQNKNTDNAMLQNKNGDATMLQSKNTDNAMLQNKNGDTAMSQNRNSDTAMLQDEVTEQQQNATFETEWNNTISEQHVDPLTNTISEQHVDPLTNTNKKRPKRNTFQSILRDLSIIKASTDATNENYLMLYQMTSSMKRNMDRISNELEHIRNGKWQL